MKVKALSRRSPTSSNPGQPSTARHPRNLAPTSHPFERAREYTRALNAVKLTRLFSAPFIGALEPGHTDGVYSLAANPTDLSRAVSGAGDGTVKIWDLASRSETWSTQAHGRTNVVKGVSWTRGGGVLSCAADRSVRLFEQSAGGWGLKGSYEGPTAFNALSVHRDGEVFAAAADQVSIYSLRHMSATPTMKLQWPTALDTVTALAFNQVETAMLVSAATSRALVLYDMRLATAVHRSVLSFAVNSVAWNPMEAFNFAAASEDHNIYLFDSRNLKRASNVLKDHVHAVTSVAFSPTGEELVSSGYDRTVRLWKRGEGHSRDVYHTNRMQRVFSATFTADSKYVLSGSDDGTVRVWRAEAGSRSGIKSARERSKRQYDEKLVERWGHMPEIRRIKKHKRVPRTVKKAAEIKDVEVKSRKRRAENERQHSKKGLHPRPVEREKMVLATEE
ncbi:MAG: rRNA-processing protein sof1 [Vezdaea aestivalis]|nr:MAG: rRNA-processing protein sof1 [Vezdaea aestivalis]